MSSMQCMRVLIPNALRSASHSCLPLHPILAGAWRRPTWSSSLAPPNQNGGRLDNPQYRTFYCAGTAVAAVGESFGDDLLWDAETITFDPLLPGSRRSIVTYELPDKSLLDLDDPAELVPRMIRPSRVVTRSDHLRMGAPDLSGGPMGGCAVVVTMGSRLDHYGNLGSRRANTHRGGATIS